MNHNLTQFLHGWSTTYTLLAILQLFLQPQCPQFRLCPRPHYLTKLGQKGQRKWRVYGCLFFKCSFTLLGSSYLPVAVLGSHPNRKAFWFAPYSALNFHLLYIQRTSTNSLELYLYIWLACFNKHRSLTSIGSHRDICSLEFCLLRSSWLKVWSLNCRLGRNRYGSHMNEPRSAMKLSTYGVQSNSKRINSRRIHSHSSNAHDVKESKSQYLEG